MGFISSFFVYEHNIFEKKRYICSLNGSYAHLLKTFKQYWQVEQHESSGNLRLTGVAFTSLQLYNN